MTRTNLLKGTKTLVVAIALATTIAFTGCGNKETTTQTTVEAQTAKEATNTEIKTVEHKDEVKEAKEEIKAEETTVTKEDKAEVVEVSNNVNNEVEEAAPVEETVAAPTLSPVEEAQQTVNNTFDPAMRVIALTNLYRAQNGLGFVYYDPTLTAMANVRAQEIITCWSHTRPDGTNATALASEYGLGYGILGENLGEYQTSADEVVNAWIASPSHQQNLVGPFSRIGVGIAVDGEGYIYWAQLFAD